VSLPHLKKVLATVIWAVTLSSIFLLAETFLFLFMHIEFLANYHFYPIASIGGVIMGYFGWLPFTCDRHNLIYAKNRVFFTAIFILLLMSAIFILSALVFMPTIISMIVAVIFSASDIISAVLLYKAMNHSI
jgi:hypothetical protein